MTQTSKPGTRRTRTVEGWVHVQILQADGSWWNVTVTRATGK